MSYWPNNGYLWRRSHHSQVIVQCISFLSTVRLPQVQLRSKLTDVPLAQPINACSSVLYDLRLSRNSINVCIHVYMCPYAILNLHLEFLFKFSPRWKQFVSSPYLLELQYSSVQFVKMVNMYMCTCLFVYFSNAYKCTADTWSMLYYIGLVQQTTWQGSSIKVSEPEVMFYVVNDVYLHIKLRIRTLGW